MHINVKSFQKDITLIEKENYLNRNHQFLDILEFKCYEQELLLSKFNF